MSSAKTAGICFSECSNGNTHAERTLLRAAEERAVLLETRVELDELGASEELHDHAPVRQ
jgi:uncharacterized protein YbcI